MKTDLFRPSAPFAALLLLFALCVHAAAAELSAAAESLIFKLEVYETDQLKKAADRRGELRANAEQALQKRLGEAMEAGQLDAAIALRTVIAALATEEAAPVLAKTENLPTGVAEQLMAMHRAEAEADAAAAATVREKTLQVVKVLEQQVLDATRAGELDAAKALQTKVEAMRPEEVEEGIGSALPDLGGGDSAGAVLPLDTRLIKGLATYEFDALEKQTDDDNTGIHFGEFGEPVTKRKISGRVANWRWKDSRNAIAVGYLKIEEAGEYSFSTYNWWDRNALYVLDLEKPLCRYRDHGAKHKIQLEAGYVPIVAVGYPRAKGDFAYAGWKPPGAEQHEKIPDELLYHSRTAAEELVRQLAEDAGSAE